MKSSSKKRDECHYHLCRKTSALHQCTYCSESFCTDHLVPKEAIGLPRFEEKTWSDKLFMDDWRKTEGHPCPAFLTYLEQKKQSDALRYEDNLDKILREPVDRRRFERPELTRQVRVPISFESSPDESSEHINYLLHIKDLTDRQEHLEGLLKRRLENQESIFDFWDVLLVGGALIFVWLLARMVGIL